MSAAVLGAEYERRVIPRTSSQPQVQRVIRTMNAQAQASVEHSSDDGPAFDLKQFRKLFDRAYREWFSNNTISPELRKEIESYDVSAEDFEKITLNRQYQRYVALIEGRIRFDELPGPPHGAVIGRIVKTLEKQLHGPNDFEILEYSCDDGMLPSCNC